MLHTFMRKLKAKFLYTFFEEDVQNDEDRHNGERDAPLILGPPVSEPKPNVSEPGPGSPPQDLRVYHKGNSHYINTKTSFGVCLMGGGRRVDSALQWFLEKAGGGDVVVLRITDYSDELTNPESSTNVFWNLGACHSITSLVIDSREKANSAYVEQVVRNAEAIWLPGGDQTEYCDVWNATKTQEIVNYVVNEKKISIGGTSAGMHCLGRIIHAPYGGNSVISKDALDNPYLPPGQVRRSAGISFKVNFFDIPYMENIITDTHWSKRNRMGRSFVFLARIIADGRRSVDDARLIACNEGTAVCVDENGLARIFGSYPDYEDYAFFVQPNSFPNKCTYKRPLTWETQEGALTVYKICGYPDGRNTFDLNTWKSDHGEAIHLNIYRGVIEDLEQKRIDIQTPG